MRFFKGVSYTFLAYAATALSQIGVAVITARLLGPEGRGLYAVFFTTAGMIMTFLYLGFTQANLYYMNRTPDRIGTLIGNSAVLVLVASAFLASGFVMGAHIVSELLPGMKGEYVVPLLWFFGTLTLAELVTSGFVLGGQRYDLNAINITLQALCVFVSALVLFAITAGVEVAVMLRVAAVTIVLSWFFRRAWRTLGVPNVGLSWSVFIDQARFGMKNYVQNLIGLLNYRVYLLFLASMGDVEATGLFSVALLFVELMRFIPNVVGTVLLPKLTAIESKGDSSKLAALTGRHTFLFSTAVLAAVLLFSELAVHLIFGELFADAAEAVDVMVAAALVGTWYQVLTRYFTSQHQQQYTIVSGLIALVVGVIACLILIPEQGLMGAAYAFAASTCIAGSTMIVFFLRTTGVRISELLVLERRDLRYYRPLITAVNFRSNL